MWKVEGGAGFLLVKLKSEAHLQKHTCKTEWWLTPVIIALGTLRQETGEVEASPVQIYPELQNKDLPKTKTSKHQPPLQKQNKQKPKTTRKRKSLEYVYVRTGLVGSTMVPPPQTVASAEPFWGGAGEDALLGQCLGLPRFREAGVCPVSSSGWTGIRRSATLGSREDEEVADPSAKTREGLGTREAHPDHCRGLARRRGERAWRRASLLMTRGGRKGLGDWRLAQTTWTAFLPFGSLWGTSSVFSPLPLPLFRLCGALRS